MTARLAAAQGEPWTFPDSFDEFRIRDVNRVLVLFSRRTHAMLRELGVEPTPELELLSEDEIARLAETVR